MIVMRLITVLACVFVALPLAWLVYAAFIPAEALIAANIATFGVTLENFAALGNTGLWRAMGVSVLASGLAVAGQLAFGLGAAYAIRNGARLLGLVLLLMAIPSELLLVPLYRQLQGLGERMEIPRRKLDDGFTLNDSFGLSYCGLNNELPDISRAHDFGRPLQLIAYPSWHTGSDARPLLWKLDGAGRLFRPDVRKQRILGAQGILAPRLYLLAHRHFLRRRFLSVHGLFLGHGLFPAKHLLGCWPVRGADRSLFCGL